jgi:hypothetical protein
MAFLTIVMRVHARSLATPFLLQIGLVLALAMRREASRVSFLMCPFCVRCWMFIRTTRRRPRVRSGCRTEARTKLAVTPYGARSGASGAQT